MKTAAVKGESLKKTDADRKLFHKLFGRFYSRRIPFGVPPATKVDYSAFKPEHLQESD